MSVDEVEAKSRSSEVARAERPDQEKKPDAPERDAGKAEGENNGKPVASAREEARKKRRPKVFVIGGVVLTLLAIGGIYYWLANRDIESTDDAYTDGRAITIAPQVSGLVVSLDVNDNQFVKQGQTLIQIDPRQYRIDREQAEGALATAKAQYRGQQYGLDVAKKNFPAQLEAAQAQLQQAKANRAKAQADFDRQKALPKAATSQQDVDAAEAALKQWDAQVALADAQVTQNSPVPERIGETDAAVNQLKGQVEQAQARLDQADLNLSWTAVKAPQDGWITKRNVEKGNYVAPGQQIFSIVSPEVWVTANFKESQLAEMRPGQHVTIKVDAYPQLRLEGHVDSIQLGSGSKFTAFPPENATGNFIKIVQRVPVKIIIDKGLDPNTPLPLGISVEPTVTVR
jgi:membrane fusion protein (multidrug efflux system)